MRARSLAAAAVLLLCAWVPADAGANTCYNIGAWNIEHFNDGARRGFPEQPGAFGPRGPEEIASLAWTIREVVKARLLALSEINGVPGEARSVELGKLVQQLGSGWEYRIARAGGKQRVALLWDGSFARLNGDVHEIRVAEQMVQGKDIFARDPLMGHFTLLEGGTTRNDLVVVALHLAAVKHLTANHDTAMERLRGELRALRGRVAAYPGEEDDVVLAGDLNASAFDSSRERLFEDFNRGNWALLAGTDYPRTRFNGSRIDYVIATARRGRQKGLVGEEIVPEPAKVWTELAASGDAAYRQQLSDHFPVTACVRVVHDSD